VSDLLAALVGAEKCVSCAACAGSGLTLYREPCPSCGGQPWISHGWACKRHGLDTLETQPS